MASLDDMTVNITVTAPMMTKVGYVAIYGSGDCFGRTLADYPILYEGKQDCEADAKEETGFIAIAKVTWEEPA